MMLAGRAVCGESFRIIAELLELIVSCIADCQLSHWVAGSLKKLCLRLFESRRHYDWDSRVLWFDNDS